MSRFTAVWVDEERALLVTITPFGMVIQRLRSEQQPQRFHRKLVQMLRDDDDIYLCGPDGARNELRAVLEKIPGGAARIRAVEAAEPMSDRQFKVRAQMIFARPRRRPNHSAG